MSDDDSGEEFDAWLRRSMGRGEPAQPDPSPDTEGVRHPDFGGGRVGTQPDFGARSPVTMQQAVSLDDLFKRTMRDEVDGMRYPGGLPMWRQ